MLDRDDEDPRARSWSDNFRKRLLSNADPTLQIAASKRRLSMFNTGEKSGIDNPSFVTEKSDLQDDKPRSWTDKFRVRFGPTEPMTPSHGAGNPDRANRRMSMFCRMERINSYGNVDDLQDHSESNSSGSQNGKSNGKPGGNSKKDDDDDSSTNQPPPGPVPEIVFSHF